MYILHLLPNRQLCTAFSSIAIAIESCFKTPVSHENPLSSLTRSLQLVPQVLLEEADLQPQQQLA